jgi:hypothetical protein
MKQGETAGAEAFVQVRCLQKIAAAKEASVDSVEYLWQRAFFAVLTEVDSEKFVGRLIVADDEVFERLLELEGTVGTAAERLALEDTLQSLRLLRNYDYHFRL